MHIPLYPYQTMEFMIDAQVCEISAIFDFYCCICRNTGRSKFVGCGIEKECWNPNLATSYIMIFNRKAKSMHTFEQVLPGFCRAGIRGPLVSIIR